MSERTSNQKRFSHHQKKDEKTGVTPDVVTVTTNVGLLFLLVLSLKALLHLQHLLFICFRILFSQIQRSRKEG